MLAGRIVETGDAALAHELHEEGYAAVRGRHPDVAAEEQKLQDQQEETRPAAATT
jgi:Fe-S cluster assembly ATP-binding protein